MSGMLKTYYGGWLFSKCVLCLVTQSCLTLCHPMDCSLPGPSVHGILQARILEWVAMPSSRESSRSTDRTSVSCITGRFFITGPPGKPIPSSGLGPKSVKGKIWSGDCTLPTLNWRRHSASFQWMGVYIMGLWARCSLKKEFPRYEGKKGKTPALNDEFVDFAHPEMLLLGHAAYPKNTVLHQLASGGVFTTSGPWLLREGPWLLPAWFLYVSELALFL